MGDTFYQVRHKILSDIIPLSMPYSIYIYPTTFCNFRCSYCAHSLDYDAMKREYDFIPESMTIDTFKVIVHQLRSFSHKLKLLSLTGQGEPLLNSNIADMVELAKKNDIAERIEIITNASLLTKKMSDDLLDAGLDALRISLQGLSGKKYKEICKIDMDFDEFVENIKYFHQKKGNTDLFIKIMDIALDDENKLYDLFGDCTDRVAIEHMMPTYSNVDKTAGIKITHNRYGTEIKKLREVCPLCFYMLGIFPNGDVQPCSSIYKPIILGNVHRENLQDMWKGDMLQKFWKMQLECGKNANRLCLKCNAPNDCAHIEDNLDNNRENILIRLQSRWGMVDKNENKTC